MTAPRLVARRYRVRGRVQGVGYRNFVLREAVRLGLSGYARNCEDGSVEVYAHGSKPELDELAGLLRIGPRWADVRTVEESEAAMLQYEGFRIR